MSVVEYWTENSIAYIKINRPDVNNALSREVFDRLDEILDEFVADDGADVAILHGADGNFSSGFDLGDEIAELEGFDEEEIRRKNVDESVGGLVRGKRIYKPIIAAVEGWCLAGGFETALACDIRVAGEEAKFGLYHVWEGMPNGDGGSVRLPLIAGLGNALELSLTGKHVTAKKAEEMDIVNRVAPDGEALEYAEKYAELITELPQEAVRAQKETIIETAAGGNLAQMLQYEGVLMYNGSVMDVVTDRAQQFVDGELDHTKEKRFESLNEAFQNL
jgi:enoyl-CoA hydratase/carnithine racemase